MIMVEPMMMMSLMMIFSKSYIRANQDLRVHVALVCTRDSLW